MVSEERQPILGILGASPPVVSSGKAPGGVRGLCPLKLKNYQ